VSAEAGPRLPQTQRPVSGVSLGRGRWLRLFIPQNDVRISAMDRNPRIILFI